MKILWREDVFFKPKSLAQVGQELEMRGYNFSPQAVDMALKLAKFLTRKGTKMNFTYVQKYPYVEEKASGK